MPSTSSAGIARHLRLKVARDGTSHVIDTFGHICGQTIGSASGREHFAGQRDGTPRPAGAWSVVTVLNRVRFPSIFAACHGPLTSFIANLPATIPTIHDGSLTFQLRRFAEGHPYDILSPNVLLTAAYHWVDITTHPSRMIEPSAESQSVPNTSLAVFLVYYPFWLREAAHNGQPHYIHPFQFVQTGYDMDMVIGERFRINEGLINQNIVIEAVSRALCYDDETEISNRYACFPQTLPNSGTVLTSDTPSKLNQTEVAILGLGSVVQYGLPKDRIQAYEVSETIDIAVPDCLLQATFHGPTSPLPAEIGSDFFVAHRPGVTSLFGDCISPGPFWEPLFATTGEPWGGRMNLSLETNRTHADKMVSDEFSRFFRSRMDKRLRNLQTMGILPEYQTELRVDRDMLPYMPGMMTYQKFAALSVEDQAKIKAQNQALYLPQFRTGNDDGTQDQSSGRHTFMEDLIGVDELAAMIDALADRPRMSHIEFRDAEQRLRQIQVSGAIDDRKASNVMAIIEFILGAHESDIDYIRHIIDEVNTPEPWIDDGEIQFGLPVFARRLMGLDAFVVSTPNGDILTDMEQVDSTICRDLRTSHCLWDVRSCGGVMRPTVQRSLTETLESLLSRLENDAILRFLDSLKRLHDSVYSPSSTIFVDPVILERERLMACHRETLRSTVGI